MRGGGSGRADAELQAHIERIAEQWPTYGYRRVTVQLRREGAGAVNGKRVRRLMGELGLAGQAPPRRCRTTNSDHSYPRYPNLVRGLAITAPDQVWVADITYVRVRCDFVYLAVLMDVFTRAIRGWEVSRCLDQALTLTALPRALRQHAAPQVHHSDQGCSTPPPPTWPAWNNGECRSPWRSKGSRGRTVMPSA